LYNYALLPKLNYIDNRHTTAGNL